MKKLFVILNDNGYHVSIASKASEALNIFKKKKGDFNLIISDIVLPDKNGLQISEKLLSLKTNLKLLLCSGYSGQKAKWHKIKNKGYAFLQKPFTLDGLLSKIKDILTNDK